MCARPGQDLLGMQAEMRREALHLVEEFRERNRAALLNLLADGTAGTTLFAMLARYTEGRVALFNTIGRVFTGLSDTAKAFLIIAGAPRLLASPTLLPSGSYAQTWIHLEVLLTQEPTFLYPQVELGTRPASQAHISCSVQSTAL